MKRSVAVVTVVAFVVALVGTSYASPYWAVHQLRAAADAADADALQDYVDFPALRESIKAEIQAKVVVPEITDPKLQERPLGGIGAMVASAMIGSMVDAMVTPAGVASMMRGKPDPKAAALPSSAGSSAAQRGEAPRARYAYDGFNRFSVTYQDGDKADRSVALILRRDGLFGWKLVRVKLPALK